MMYFYQCILYMTTGFLLENTLKKHIILYAIVSYRREITVDYSTQLIWDWSQAASVVYYMYSTQLIWVWSQAALA